VFNETDILANQPVMIENQSTRRRILIVDDEPFNIMCLKTFLCNFDIQNIELIIDEAYNGKIAVDMVRHSQEQGLFSYGLIFMDLSMPIMDGFEASTKIR